MRARFMARLVLLLVVGMFVPCAAQAPSGVRTIEFRCRAGVPFRWRAGDGPFEASRSNQQRVPVFDASGESLTYEVEVDERADFWHRWRFLRRGIRAVEYLSTGYEFEPQLVLDSGRVTFAFVLPLGVAALLVGMQLSRGRRLRQQLVEASVRLTEAEASSGLFPLDGSVPSRIDCYEVVSKLGMGGMAVVYRVRRRDQEYALKLPLPNLLDEPEFRARFAREGRLGGSMQHANLVHIYDVCDGEGAFGYPYIVMELVSGVSLKERMQLGSLNVDKIVRLGLQVLDALALMHARGIVHRDIKPGNIMVTASGNAKVMDFGIAFSHETSRLTSTGDLLGTPMYLAPEQIGGDQQSIDPRVDVYGVGMMLYEALAGRLPWSSTDSVAAVLEKVTHDPSALSDFRPDVPPKVAAAIMRMIARNPDDRPASAAAARDELRLAVGL